MKNLASYLVESEKTYDFKIKIAGIEMNNDALDRLEHSLKGFDVAKISKATRLPMCDKPMDFPSFGPVEVSIITASLKYPCTDEQVRVALGSQGRFPLANVVVVSKNSPEELRRDEESSAASKDEPKNKKSKLESEIEKVESGQPLVGMQKVESLMKELESARKQKQEFAKTEKVDSKSTNDLPQNNKSPSGSRNKGAK
jgi:hypothetical protein